MRNMKTLLRLLGAVSLSTVAVSSVVACGGGDKIINMDTQVAKDFGFLDVDGKSKMKVKLLTTTMNIFLGWRLNISEKITADSLLQNGGESAKAKSSQSADFLVNVLKLNPTGGTGADRTFKHIDAQQIDAVGRDFSPTIDKKSDNSDYVVTGGKFNIIFEKGTGDNTITLGEKYLLDILGDQNNGVVLSVLPQLSSITLADFNAISGFIAGQPKSAFPVDTDLTQYFKTDTTSGKIVKKITDLIKPGYLKIKVSQGASGTGNLAPGDFIKIKISIGEVTFTTQYTLTIT